MRFAVGGIDQHAGPVGLRAVGDPHLRSADHVVAAILACGGLDVRNIGAGARFGYRDRYDHVALDRRRSEEHTSELQSLMRISYAVFCLKKKKKTKTLNMNNIKTPEKH